MSIQRNINNSADKFTETFEDFTKVDNKASHRNLKEIRLSSNDKFKRYTKAGVATLVGLGLMLGASIGTRNMLEASTNKSGVLVEQEKGKDTIKEKGELLETLTAWVSRANKIDYTKIESNIEQYGNYLIDNRDVNTPGEILRMVERIKKNNKAEVGQILEGEKVNNPTNFIISYPTNFFAQSGLADKHLLTEITRCNMSLTVAEFLGIPVETISRIESQLTTIKRNSDPYSASQDFERMVLAYHTEVRAGNEMDIPTQSIIKEGDITFWRVNDLLCISVPKTYRYQDVRNNAYNVEQLMQMFGK